MLWNSLWVAFPTIQQVQVFDFQNYHWKLAACSIISILLFVGCAAEDEDSSSSSTSFSIGGTVTGLSGVLIIQNNSGDDTVVEKSAKVDFIMKKCDYVVEENASRR